MIKETVNRYYDDYEKLYHQLNTKDFNLSNDSIGCYIYNQYCVDITVRNYDNVWCIDYDIYILEKNVHLDGGYICSVIEMPLTDNEFWGLIKKKFQEIISLYK